MKRFLSMLLCAAIIVLGVNAAPVKVSEQLRTVKKAKTERVRKAVPVRKNAKAVLFNKAAKQDLAVKAKRAPRKAKQDVSFEIAISNISFSTADVTVTPSDNEATYYFDALEASQAEAMSDAEIVALFKEYFEDDAADNEMSIQEYMAYMLSQGEDAYTFKYLSPSTEYTVVAVLMDENAEAQGAMTRKNFKTLDPIAPTGEIVDLGELELDYFGDWRDYDGSIETYFVNDTLEIALCIFDEDVSGEFTLADLDLDYSYYSSDEIGQLGLQSANITATLSADGKSSALVVSIVANNGVQYNFTATIPLEEGGGEGGDPVDPTGGTFTIDIQNITSSGAKITVTPSVEGATFYWSVATAEEIAGLSDADIVKNVILAEIQDILDYYGSGTISDVLLDEEDSWTYASLNANTEYVVVAAYLDADGNLQESVVKQNFKTLEQQVVDLTFTFQVTEDGFIIVPSNNNDKWDYIFFDPADVAEYGADACAAYGYSKYGDSFASAGSMEVTYAELIAEEFEPGEYSIVVYGCDGGVTTPAAYFNFVLTETGGYPMGIEQVEIQKMDNKKIILDGVLYIVRDGKIYTAQGATVK